ncbi:DUF1801 domain-containing protein [bacterium]|nr:MAG: DUF1801 domain-containing protein [bacterium]
MQSEAKTVRQYLDSLPADRRHAIGTIRDTIVANLPRGYKEVMNWGMITYQVPLSVCPDTYNGQPLMYAALASQKNYMAVYLTAVYMDDALRRGFEAAYKASGKRMDMGKSCVRFRRLEDIPIDLVASSIRSMPMAEFADRVGGAHSARQTRKAR